MSESVHTPSNLSDVTGDSAMAPGGFPSFIKGGRRRKTGRRKTGRKTKTKTKSKPKSKRSKKSKSRSRGKSRRR